MNIKKIIITALLAGTVVLGMTACNDKSPEIPETTGADTKVETPADTASETEPATEDVTETEPASESEPATETEPVIETETETESVTEKETETEPVTEPVPEFDTEIINVALNKYASSNNSIEAPEGYFGVNQLIDGSYDDDFNDGPYGANTPLGWHNQVSMAGQSSADNPTYIIIDFGDVYKISSVKLIPMAFYKTGGSVFPRDFSLQYSTDGQTWNTVITATDVSCQWGVDEPLVYDFDPVEATMFRMSITRDSALNGGYDIIGEIEVYGCARRTGVQPDDKPSAGDKPNISASDLDPLMQNIFAGNTVMDETVMFIEKTDVKTLLYPIDSVISVTSFDGKKIYEEGKDYVVEGGKFKLVEGSSIPVITPAKYYNVEGSILQTLYNGKYVLTYWGEARAMIDWQIKISYNHSGTWEGETQPCEAETFEKFLKKLEAGEDVTVCFYGDSITYGANATWLSNYEPQQYPYTILFTQALADLFGYTVHYEQGTARVPSKDYVAGTRGTITYINTAVGGWASVHGVENLQTSVIDRVEKSGCDLFVVAFGMNDPGTAIRTVQNNVRKMVDGVLAVAPDASIVLLSTMVPNPNATSNWYGLQVKQEPVLAALAKEYNQKGVACGVARMTTVSQAVLTRKEFHDYSGNNINHPNDFFIRVYAQTLLQTVVGYENMN